MSEFYHGPADIVEWVEWVRRKVRNDDDAVLIIEGLTGSAKSSLAVLLSRVCQDHPVKVNEQFFWRPEGTIQAARDLPEFSVIVLDEAVSVNRRRSMATANVDLLEHLNIMRTFHQIVIFCIPDRHDLDMSVQKRAAWLFTCGPRGKFVAKQRTSTRDREPVFTPRFSDRFHDPAETQPDLWADYMEAKKAFSYRGDDPKKPLREALIQAYRKKIRTIIQGEREPFVKGQGPAKKERDEGPIPA